MYTEKANRLLAIACASASRSGSAFVELRHLLDGILVECTLVAGRKLISPQSDIEFLKSLTAFREPRPIPAVPLSPDVELALVRADEEAKQLRNRRIGTEHIALGLLQAENPLAADTLRMSGCTVEELRATLRELNRLHGGG